MSPFNLINPIAGGLASARRWLRAATLGFVALLAACGGGGGEAPQGGQAAPSVISESPSPTAVVGTSATFSVAASGATAYQWQKLEGSRWLDLPGATGAVLTVPGVSMAMNGWEYRVVVSNSAGSVTSSVFTLTVKAQVAAPLITAHPADTVVVEGAGAGFAVAATGDTLVYAWALSSDGGVSWLAIPGANGATLTLPNLTLADSGKRYRARVSNEGGFVDSGAARLTVTAAPVAPTIATQPTNQAANPGDTVSFVVSALGTELAYQWQLSTDGGASWAAVPGAGAATLTLAGVSLADHGKRFRVVVSNSVGSVTSAAASLSVTVAVVPVTITAHPLSVTVIEGQTAQFSVTAQGTSPAYEWQVSSNGGVSWAAPGGGIVANTPTLTIAGVQMADSGRQYRALVSNSAGPAVPSLAATLTVKPLPTPPKIDVQPVGAARIVGQTASFTVAATAVGATPAYQWESRSGSGPWAPITGAVGSTHTIGAVNIADDTKSFRATVSANGHTVFSDEAPLQVAWGSVETSADTSQLESFGGGDDGGSPGGGDGAGTDGGGGLGKTVNALVTVQRLADGALVGKALTHPVTGLVKIKAGPGTAPLLLTLSGNDQARYYDEGKAAQGASVVDSMLPFDKGQVLHALVDKLDENLGVTPLTEAAYRYAINQFVVDPKRVAEGLEPLRHTATASELAQLSAEQIRQAHARILDEVNSKLADIYKLESLKSLPTPVDGTPAIDAIKLSRYGRQQAVTGGLVAAAGLFKTVDLRQPALALVEQLARDLTDGKLDGYALDGTLAAEGDKPVYDSIRLPVDLAIGANQQAERFGSQTLYPLVPTIQEVGEQWATYANDCPRWNDRVSLLKDGSVRAERTEFSAPKGAPPLCAQTSKTTVVPNFATAVRLVQSNGYQGFLVQSNGGVLGWGNASCGMLGNGMIDGVVDVPRPIPALAKLTSMAIGTYAVAARDAGGQVFTFGSDAEGALGLGPRVPGAVSCAPAGTKLPLPTVLTPQPVSALRDTVSVHVVRGKTFYAIRTDGLWGWGSGETMAFGGDSTAARDVPALVAGVKAVRNVGGTRDATFALLTKGVVVGWGNNAFGGFGDGTTSPKLAPALVPLGGVLVQDLVTDGVGQAIALLDDGRVLGWGPSFDRVDPTTGKLQRLAARAPKVIDLPGGAKIRHVQLGNGPDAVIYLLAQDGKVFKLDGLRQPFVAQDVTAGFQ
jgi:hypothetical protein